MMKMRKYISALLVAVMAAGIMPGAWGRNDNTTPLESLSGVRGYGEGHDCIQDPGAQAGAYIYAGTSVPYEAPSAPLSIPDSLDAIFVNHVGRHGSRYLTSGKWTEKLQTYLDSCGALTPVGGRALRLCAVMDSVTDGRWGELDNLGHREQEGIGKRFARAFDLLLNRNDSILSFASPVPRCAMSMDCMTHGIILENRNVELSSGSGNRYIPLLRGFSVLPSYKSYISGGSWEKVLDSYCDTVIPTTVALRLTEKGSRLLQRLGRDLLRRGVDDSGAALETALADTLRNDWPVDWCIEADMTKEKAMHLAHALYKIVAGAEAIDDSTLSQIAWWQLFFTTAEYRSLWQCADLDRYLRYSASSLSDIPPATAKALLGELTRTLDEAAKPDYNGPAAILRFGHAETIMPLFALMGLPDARYVSDDFNTVPDHWMDASVAPMAANLQMVLCRSKVTGNLFLINYVNEQPSGTPVAWDIARDLLMTQAGI